MTTKELLKQREQLIKRVDKAVNDISLAYLKVGRLKDKEDATNALENATIHVLEYSNALSDLIQFYDKEIGLIYDKKLGLIKKEVK